MMNINWRPISEYRRGEALFYYPAVVSNGHEGNSHNETYEVGSSVWVNRKPTYFCYVERPTK